MKNLFLLCAISLLFMSCFEVERHCADFKTGEFEFNYVVDGINKTGRFIRTDSLNIDYYEGKIDSSSVRWINDCEFILKKLNPKTNAERDAIHMKILTTNGTSSYTFEYKLAAKKPNKPQRSEKGIAYRIN
ncbi:hypothetical protein BWZ20_02100 [Winogradskyella sp. J14-2]|uniref:hypothetical protein n=1 Tax=Winogradskyella sp. J14-2 TaxID=1936080 RepID=UPI0009727C14|nr:hypothetical protein [Winogradskyella sp. J14-2]APY07167.1 hypothetical protein BWZ20_02100 [Winogradskyella sp. J14-2]